MERKEEAAPPQVIYAVPPSIDAKTWSEVQKRWAEVEEKRIEAQKERDSAIREIIKDIASRFERYYTAKTSRIAWPSYALITGIIIASTFLTWIGRVGGETYAFLMGTVIGYLISILTKITGGS